MKAGTIGWVILFFAVFFAFVSQAILSIKMLEFRNQLTKSQIMNYEFSSKALREKFKEMLGHTEDIKAEIQANVLESSILN
ncbi:MAG: hypothetical protein K8R21_03405, partial [Leptospira sp.]|nr:hypothetical protein [Leptospira sp.]